MKNSYLDNKVVLKYCSDYYRIINEEFSELDYMTDKIITIFQSYIFRIDITDKSALKKVGMLNKAVARYIDDREFKTLLTSALTSLKVSKKETDVIGIIVKTIIDEYKKYMEGFTRNLYIPRWI
jgi:hypothetical protein